MVVSDWSPNAVVLAVLAAVAAVHLPGLRASARVLRRGGQRRAGAVKQAVAFYAGLLTVALALVSPLAYWAHRFIWVRSIQDLLLAVVAPSLIVLGAPWLALTSGARLPVSAADHRRWTERPDNVREAKPRRGTRWRPVMVTVVFNAAWWAWHVPALYDAALRSPWVYAMEVVLYLGVGVVFWLQLIGSAPFTPRFPPLRRVMLVSGTIVANTVMAMVLVFGSGVLYPAYTGPTHRVLGVVADQQLGGAVLWVAVLPPFIITAVALILRWLNEEESEDLAAGLDRLLNPRTSGWPSRSNRKFQ